MYYYVTIESALLHYAQTIYFKAGEDATEDEVALAANKLAADIFQFCEEEYLNNKSLSEKEQCALDNFLGENSTYSWGIADKESYERYRKTLS